MQFSALTSVYEKEKPEYLDQALESLHKQTLQADEVVIVHDGLLTEELYSCLEKWKRRPLPIKEIKFPKNKGLIAALNAGLKECSHETVARFDTDDINDPKRFEMQIKHLEKNPKISVLGTRMQIFSESPEKAVTECYIPLSYKEIKERFVRRCSMVHPSCIYRRKDVLSAGGYSRNFYGVEDSELWLRMLARGYVFANIPEKLLFYRISKQKSYFFFNTRLKVSHKKRWGLSLALSTLLLLSSHRKCNTRLKEYTTFVQLFNTLA